MKKIWIFDFDGTITTKDTLFEFLKFTHGKKTFYVNMVILSPILILYILKIVSNEKAKELILNFFYKGVKKHDFDSKCNAFVNEIDKLQNKNIMKIINQQIDKKNEVYIVSASIENWIIPWAISKNINHVIATKIEFKNGSFTGLFSSKNCYGKEKVNRLLSEIDFKSYYIIAYGDSNGDKQMLEFADESYWVTKNKITKYEK